MLKSRFDEQLLNLLFSVTSLFLLVCMTDVCTYYSWNAKECTNHAFDINGNWR
jgi:hypothetical protein